MAINIPIDEDKYSYLFKYKQNELKASGTSNVVIDFVHSAGSSQYALKITGPANSVKLCETRTKQQLQSVFTGKFIFEVRSGLSDDSVKDVVRDIARRNSCTARLEISDHVDWDTPEDAQRLNGTGEDPFVTVVFNEIQKQTADVIVNTLHRNLTLGVGKVSSALLRSCGHEVQDELRHKYPHGIVNGEVAVSSSGSMWTCQQIYHGALPAHKGLEAVDKETCYQNMILLVYNCLKEASSSGHVTIALPALGTGALEYPAEDVAYLMFRAVRLFLAHCPYTSLEQIYFVLYPSVPRELKQIFLSYCVTQTLESSVVDALCFDNGHDTEGLDVVFWVGQTLVKVVNADLTKACHRSCPQLVLWNKADVDLQMNSYNSFCGHTFNSSDLSTTLTALDTDPSSSRTVIHSYIGGNERDLKRAVKKGLKRGKIENMHMMAMSVLSHDRLANDVASTTVSVLQGVKDSKSSVFVFAVFIPERNLCTEFVTAARGMGWRSLKSLESHLTSLADKTWHDFSQVQIPVSLRTLQTGNKAVLTVTSDSEQTNRRVAREMQEQIRAGVSRSNILSRSETFSGSNFTPGSSAFSRSNRRSRSAVFRRSFREVKDLFKRK